VGLIVESKLNPGSDAKSVTTIDSDQLRSCALFGDALKFSDQERTLVLLSRGRQRQQKA
jgi:hypothetical protein